MTKLFIKINFVEKRLFIQTYDCGYYTTLSMEPEIIEKCDLPIKQPVNVKQQKKAKTYEVYLAVNNLTLYEIKQALKRLKQHYPDGYVAISETNDFPNTLYQNLLAALQHQVYLLQKKWGSIAFNHFSFFNSNNQLPSEIQCQIFSNFKVDWNYDHLEDSKTYSTLQEDQQSIDLMASFSLKHYRR